MQIEILTADKSIFNGEATLANFPGTDGSFGIMSDHAPMIAALKKGNIVITTSNGEQSFEVSGGVVEVLKNKVMVLAE